MGHLVIRLVGSILWTLTNKAKFGEWLLASQNPKQKAEPEKPPFLKSQITSTKLQMVRQAVRQAHGPEQSRRTHHPEPGPGRRVNLKFQYPMTKTGFEF